MTKRPAIIVSLFLIAALALLVGCGGGQRGADARPEEDDVLSQATAVETPVPVAATQEPSTEAQPTSTSLPPAELPVALNLSVTGGILGFCDALTVDSSGEYVLDSCRDDIDGLTGVLDADDQEELQTWVKNLQGFTLARDDNAEGADNLHIELTFNGQGDKVPDAVLQQIIFDWANGLLVQARQQHVAQIPTPTPIQAGPEGFCPNISRPAMLIADYDNPSNLILIDVGSQEPCNIPLEQPPFGRIATVGGRIFYPVLNPDAKTLTVWQVSLTGEQTPLEFTTVSAKMPGPYNFVVSADGTRIAWAYTAINFDADPPVYRISLWTSNLDGSGLTTLLDGEENVNGRYLEPARFSPDNAVLYYALQPDGIQGTVFSFGGRYDALYAIPVAGGEAFQIDACGEDRPLCLGDIAPDGALFSRTSIAEGVAELLKMNGEVAAALTPPAADYIGPAIFSPSGNAAFVTALLSEPDDKGIQRPESGVINVISPPYVDPPRPILTDSRVAVVWEWLDDARLAFGAMDEAGNIGASIVTMDGQVTALSPNFPLAVLR